MSKLRPISKVCLVKSQSLNYLANKVPMNMRGWVAVAESSYWVAWPNPKKRAEQRCNFLVASLKREGGSLFVRRGIYLASRKLFGQGEGFFLQQGGKIAQNRPFPTRYFLLLFCYYFAIFGGKIISVLFCY